MCFHRGRERVSSRAMPVPVISIAQMRDWEQATWAAGQTEAEVIRRVGRCVGRRAFQLTQPGDLILILAGKGHNGEDARGAREHLADRRVEVLDVTETAADLAKLDALLASAAGAGGGWPVRHRPESAARAGLGQLYRAR